jgi:hypothetical protein
MCENIIADTGTFSVCIWALRPHRASFGVRAELDLLNRPESSFQQRQDVVNASEVREHDGGTGVRGNPEGSPCILLFIYLCGLPNSLHAYSGDALLLEILHS